MISTRGQRVLLSKLILYSYINEIILTLYELNEHQMKHNNIIWIIGIYEIALKAYNVFFWIFSVVVKLGSRKSIPLLKFSLCICQYIYVYTYTHALT